MATIDVSDTTFDGEVLSADQPVLVDFWAEWCAPCKMIAPIVEELSEEYDGRFKFTKLNVDDSPDTAAKYGVRGIPTLLIFRDGQPVDQLVGAVPRKVLKDRVEGALAKLAEA